MSDGAQATPARELSPSSRKLIEDRCAKLYENIRAAEADEKSGWRQFTHASERLRGYWAEMRELNEDLRDREADAPVPSPGGTEPAA